MSDFTKDELAVLNWCALITSSLGTLGALAIIVSYHISAQFRTPIARIMYFNAYGEIISCIGQITGFFAVNFPAEHPICQYQGAIVQTGRLWGVLGDSLVGISLFLIVVKHVSLERIHKLNNTLFVIIAIISILDGFIPLWIHSTPKGGLLYGPMMGWCSITSSYPNLQFVQVHLPIFLVFISNSVLLTWVGIVYYKVYKRIQNNPCDEASKESAKRYLQRFSILATVFTTVYILCWFSLFINRLLVFAGITTYSMFILRNTCTPLRGIFNLILFAVIAISTNTTSPDYINRNLNVYKLHLILDDEPPPPCRPTYEAGKTSQTFNNSYFYLKQKHFVKLNC
ncbi:hypothetical protein BDF19DRAFT_416007 [Syncephalis fuscata]|nr:hypothetical protein BDF19DRAFT_416007 [Syncephalis fuscata]